MRWRRLDTFQGKSTRGPASRTLAPVRFVVGPGLLLAASLVLAGPSVVDDLGNTVTLDAPARRIVSLAPHNTENLFSAGAGDYVVGRDEYSNYPDTNPDIEVVGSFAQFNLEAILKLEPDLVVGWKSANNAEALKRIEKFGIPVYYSEPRTFEEIADNIIDLGVLAGTGQFASESLDGVLERIETLRSRYHNRAPIDVFYQVWTDPLMTLNGDHFVSRVLEVCGASNLFADLPILAPRVSIEAVIEANPDVIVTGQEKDRKPDLSLWAPWDVVTAVRESAFVLVDSDVMHRHTLRMLNGIEQVCEDIEIVRQKINP